MMRCLLIGGMMSLLSPFLVHAQGTAFSYQGKLNDGGVPATGLYDLRFTVCDALTNGNVVAGPLTNSVTGISNGLFSTTLDFGSGVFTGSGRWLQMDVRTNGNGVFTPLSPREPIMPVPYAIMANSASNLLGPLPASQLPGSVLTNNQNAVNLTGTFTGNGAALTNLNAVAKSGDTMSGALNLPTNGLLVGGSQLVLSGSKVGVGTATPQSVLMVHAGPDQNIGFDGPVSLPSGATLHVYNDAKSANVPLEIRSAGLSMAMVGGSKVGIGTTTPSAKLHVGGGTRFGLAEVGSIYLQSGTATGRARDWKIYSSMEDPGGNLAFRDMGFDNSNNGMTNDALVIQYGTGNVGVGTNNPQSALHVNGTVTATGFVGNGSGLTNVSVSATALTGTISLAQLPAAVVTNGTSGVNINGTFTGNGAGLTNLPLSSSVPINPLRIAINRWYAANQVTTFASGGNGPNGMAFDGTHLWVANILSDQVVKIRASDGVLIGTYAAGSRPRALCFDGANIWVTGEPGGLTKIRASDGVTLTNIASATASYFACVFDGTNVWTLNNGGSGVLNKYNVSDGSLAAVPNCGLYGGLGGVVFDGSYLWVAGYDLSAVGKVAKVRPSDGAVIGTFTVGTNPRGVTYDGQNIWVANFSSGTVTKLRAADGVILGTYSVSPGPWDIMFDGTDIWVTDLNNNLVTRLRQSDGSVLAVYSVPSPFRLAFDGANVWVSNANSNKVTKL